MRSPGESGDGGPLEWVGDRGGDRASGGGEANVTKCCPKRVARSLTGFVPGHWCLRTQDLAVRFLGDRAIAGTPRARASWLLLVSYARAGVDAGRAAGPSAPSMSSKIDLPRSTSPDRIRNAGARTGMRA